MSALSTFEPNHQFSLILYEFYAIGSYFNLNLVVMQKFSLVFSLIAITSGSLELRI
jgi:hypothetical protein